MAAVLPGSRHRRADPRRAPTQKATKRRRLDACEDPKWCVEGQKEAQDRVDARGRKGPNRQEEGLDEMADRRGRLMRPWIDPTTMQSMVESENFQHILRVLNTNIEGKKKVMYAMTSIKGIGRRFSNLICKKADVDMSKRCVLRLKTRGSRPRCACVEAVRVELRLTAFLGRSVFLLRSVVPASSAKKRSKTSCKWCPTLVLSRCPTGS